MKKNGKHLLITGIIGLIYGIISAVVYQTLIQKVWRPLFVGGFVLLFGVIMLSVSVILNAKRGDGYTSGDPAREMKNRKGRATAAVLLIILTLCSFVFEILYEIGGKAVPQQPTSYVFLIDCSTSMKENDPKMKRADAISEIMDNQFNGLPYAIYSFTDNAKLDKNFSVYSPSDSFSFYNNGSTNILRSVSTVISDIKHNSMAGDRPRLIVLSDGNSSANGLNRTVRKCMKRHITVSTVGLSTDSPLLKELAEKTGGVYRYADNVEDLISAMDSASAAVGEIGRDLLSLRTVFRLDALYGILRVLFLLIMGVLWAIMKFKAHASTDSTEDDNVLFLGLILGVIAALMMELLHLTTIPTWLLQIVFCILWAVTPGVFKQIHTSMPDLNQQNHAAVTGTYQLDPISSLSTDSAFSPGQNLPPDPTVPPTPSGGAFG